MNRSQCANALRFLAVDAIDKCQSGHPGAPLGMAEMAETLWRHHLRHNPKNPHWLNRDRFILSNGHASALIYSLLHLSGYPLSIEDIQNFRKLGSPTPGHPEFGHTVGVECTTGPLGQGIAMAVGMALGESLLSTQFNKPDFPIIDHHTYVFVGDGCLMEGISQEAISLAGALNLSKLIVMYDDNGISIDGKVGPWFADDTKMRFISAGWNVIEADGHDFKALDAAILKAKQADKPSLIVCRTVIGQGAPTLAGSAKTHGSPFPAEEIAAMRKDLDWPYAPFEIPQDIQAAWDASQEGKKLEDEWQALFDNYTKAYPELANALQTRLEKPLSADYQAAIEAHISALDTEKPQKATRIANQAVLDAIAESVPSLLGGSADLTSSVGTWHKLSKLIERDKMDGNYLSYGVREFLMGAMMNGLALYGGFIPYGGTFLVFSDYARNAIRLSALMQQRVLWVLTHDSIGLGEDGPTHQPIEHIASLRLIPDLHVWRPCDSVETAVAWREALAQDNRPTCFCLSRQALPTLERSKEALTNIAKGAYILRQNSDTPELILIATGSEVQTALAAYEALTAKGYAIRLISMPSTTIFDAQDKTYKEALFPPTCTKRLAIEAGSPDGWWKYVGLEGNVIGMTSFGASAPAKELFAKFGFTTEAIVEKAEELL